MHLRWSALLLAASVLLAPSPADAIAEEGKPCEITEHKKPSAHEFEFFQCVRPNEYQNYPDMPETRGEWRRVGCNETSVFDEDKQVCIKKSNKRRQMANCAMNPTSVGCGASACGASNLNPVAGGSCQWQSATLQPCQQQNAFLQCNPVSQSSPCGQWQQMPCSSGCNYDPKIQVCVQQQLQNSCPQASQPVCGCSSAPTVPACPAQATCQQNTCCQPAAPAPVVQPQPIQITIAQPQPVYQPQPAPQPCCGGQVQTGCQSCGAPAPTCPGNLAPVSQSCGGCQAPNTCQPSVGCCPGIAQPQPVYQPQPIQIGIQTGGCPGNVAPIAQGCNSCPGPCVNNNCCPAALPAPQPVAQPIQIGICTLSFSNRLSLPLIYPLLTRCPSTSLIPAQIPSPPLRRDPPRLTGRE